MLPHMMQLKKKKLKMKNNYNNELKRIIASLTSKPRLLLHSCCGPCSTHVIKVLEPYFDITVIYYNPNIEPKEEYLKRKNEQIRFLKEKQIPLYDIDYNHDEFVKLSKGLEHEKEGQRRCILCIHHRLKVTKEVALKENYEYFGTTLTVSPHKNSEIINNLGNALQDNQIKYLFSDFKKENGYLDSVNLAKKYNLYRQDYCGCLYAKNKEED